MFREEESKKGKERVRNQRNIKPEYNDRKKVRYWKRIERLIIHEYGHIINPNKECGVRKWTVASANCYYRNLQCEKCIYLEFCQRLGFKMRSVVRALILNLGVRQIDEDIPPKNKKYLDKKNYNAIIE